MIRDALISDVPILVGLVRKLHEESYISRFCDDKTESSINSYIEDEDFIILVNASDNVINGFIIACVAKPFYNNCIQAHEIILYVKPEFRRMSIGALLVNEYVSWAKSRSAYEIFIDTRTAIETRKTEQFYENIGFSRIGSYYHKEEIE